MLPAMIHRTLSILALAAAALPAQTSKVLPTGMNFVEGPAVLQYPFNAGNPTAGIQLLIDAPEVTSSIAVINGMWFRPSQVTAAQASAAFTKPYIVNVYQVAMNAYTLEGQPNPYDPNLVIGGATPTTVFNGPLNVPANAPAAVVPQAFSIYIPFSNPYVFDSSLGNLLIMMESTDLTPIAQACRIDAVTFSETQTRGLVAEIAPGCNIAGNSLTTSTTDTTLIIGGSVNTQLTSSPPAAIVVALSLIGTARADVDLGPLLGMTGCTARFASWDFESLAVNTGTGFPVITTPIPLNTSLVGAAGISQAVGLTASGALVDAVVSNAQALRVGLDSPPLPTMMVGFHTVTTTLNQWSHGATGENTPVIQLDGIFP